MQIENLQFQNVNISQNIMNALLGAKKRQVFHLCEMCKKELVYMGIKISENKFKHNYKCN